MIFYGYSDGQVTKKSYEKAVDHLNYQSVYYYLSCVSETDNVTKEFEKECKCEDDPSYDKINSSIPKIETSAISLSGEIDRLKNKYNNKLNKDEVIKFLTIDVFNKSDKPTEQLRKFKTKLDPEKGDCGKYEEKVKEKVEDALIEDTEEATPGKIKQPDSTINSIKNEIAALDGKIKQLDSTINSIKNKIAAPDEEIKKLKPSDEDKPNNLFSFLALSALLLSIIGLVLTFRRRNHYKKLRDKFNNFGRRLKENDNRNISNTAKTNKLHNEIRDLESKVDDLNNQIQGLKESPQKETNHFSWQIGEQANSKNETFFLPNPNEDGSFNESSALSVYKDGKSFYKFERTGNNNAEFQIDERSIKRALNAPDRTIHPVCDAKNAFNPTARTITTIEMGKAELQNGKWTLISKAVIKYED